VGIFAEDTLYVGSVSVQSLYDIDEYVNTSTRAIITAIRTNSNIATELLKASLANPASSLKKFYTEYQQFVDSYDNIKNTGIFWRDNTFRALDYNKVTDLVESLYPVSSPLYTYVTWSINTADPTTGRYRTVTPLEYANYTLGKNNYLTYKYSDTGTSTFIENGVTKSVTSAVASGSKVTVTLTSSAGTETRTITGYNSTTTFAVFIANFADVAKGTFDPDKTTVLYLYDLNANTLGLSFNLQIDVGELDTLVPSVTLKRDAKYLDDPDYTNKLVSLGINWAAIAGITYNNASLETITQQYKHFLDIFGLSYDDVKQQLEEADDQNGQETTIGYATFRVCPNIYSSEPAVYKYMYEFFDYLRTKHIERLQAEDALLNITRTYTDADIWSDPLIVYYNLADSGTNSIGARRITKTSYTGSIAQDYLKTINTTWTDPTSTVVGYMELTKKIDANNYDVLRIEGLEFKAEFPFYDSDTNTYQVNNQGNVFQLTSDTLSEAYRNAVVPLHIPTLNLLNTLEQERLTVVGASFVVFSQQTVYLEWYESGQFLDFFQATAIIVSLGTGIDVTSTFWGNVGNIAAQILVSYGVVRALEYVAKEIDNEFLQGILTAAIIYMYFTYGFGDKASDAIKILTTVDAVGEAYFNVQFESLLDNWESFSEEAEALQAYLEESTRDLLNGGLSNKVLQAIELYRIRYESPDQFYFRTLNTNPGVITLDYVKNFAKSSLDHTNVKSFEELDENFVSGSLI